MADSNISLPSIIGVKAGMTRIFDESGSHVPVTVIKLIPNLVSQVKTKEKDGYDAYQVAYYEKRESLINEPTKGHLKKATISKSLARFAEVRLDTAADTAALGKEVSLESFKANTIVDVSGDSKGRGFQGVMKRHGFSGGPATHGSHFHRRPGSIGNRATPGRVFRGKKMPGHMGVDQKTVQNIVVVEVNQAKGYLLLKGSVPGGKEGFIKITKALKKA